MHQSIAHMALLVADYDDALAFYVGKLGFVLVEDTLQPEQNKRWVVIAPPGYEPGKGLATLLLARASSEGQAAFIGDQAGGRVFLFLQTDDFDRDYQRFVDTGVTFIREPKQMEYGKVAVFEDLYGNLWDLVEFADDHPMRVR